jgi:hypothetical protein
VVVLVRAVHDPRDPALDNELGAFIAGEKRHVNLHQEVTVRSASMHGDCMNAHTPSYSAPFDISGVLVQDRIHFRVTDVLSTGGRQQVSHEPDEKTVYETHRVLGIKRGVGLTRGSRCFNHHTTSASHVNSPNNGTEAPHQAPTCVDGSTRSHNTPFSLSTSSGTTATIYQPFERMALRNATLIK